MSHKICHTIRRNDIFYFNIRLPDGNISRTSLKTDSPRKAATLVKIIKMELSKMDTNLSHDLIKFLVTRVLQRSHALTHPLSKSHQQNFQIYSANNYHQSFKDWITTRIESTASLPIDTSWQDAPVCLNYIHHHKQIIESQTTNICNAYRENNHSKVRDEVSALRDMYSLPTPPAIPQHATPAAISCPTYKAISDVLFTYLGKEHTPRMITNKKAAHKSFLPTLADVPVSDITHIHIENAWEDLNERKPLSNSSLKDKRAFLSDLFKFSQRQSYILSNPLDLCRLNMHPDRVEIRSLFSQSQRNSILSYCKSNLSDPRSWFVLIMAYSGMRNSEALSCKILRDENTGILYFNIPSGKTKAAKRKIPVHEQLVSLGIEEVFPDLLSSQNHDLTQYYSTTIKRSLSLPDRNNADELISLYSLRHNFITALQGLSDAPPAHTKYLIGHSDITSNYTHLSHTQFGELQRIINQI